MNFFVYSDDRTENCSLLGEMMASIYVLAEKRLVMMRANKTLRDPIHVVLTYHETQHCGFTRLARSRWHAPEHLRTVPHQKIHSGVPHRQVCTTVSS
jgi:hypothetical protein